MIAAVIYTQKVFRFVVSQSQKVFTFIVPFNEDNTRYVLFEDSEIVAFEDGSSLIYE